MVLRYERMLFDGLCFIPDRLSTHWTVALVGTYANSFNIPDEFVDRDVAAKFSDHAIRRFAPVDALEASQHK